MSVDRYSLLDARYAEGYDEGQEAILGELVCSVCGRNHDRDESAACENAGVIEFSDWVARASEFLSNAHDFGRSGRV